MKILVAGTFDLFHKGHEFFITSALHFAQKNDEFHVIIATDKNVYTLKKKFPYTSEEIRKKTVYTFLRQSSFCKQNNIKIFVHIGDNTDFLKLPQYINPDIICFGYDQTIPKNLKTTLPHCIYYTIDSYFPEKYKTSKIKKA